jgi:nitronate monooxygenase
VTVPLVAAGGVATATRFAELIRLGADGVRVGTRFVVAPEAGAHPEYVRRLLAATAADTVITEWFNEGWPDAPHRVLRSALEAAQRSGWRSTMPPYRSIDRDPGDMAMYAGTGVDAINRVASAASIVAELVSEL